jgi:hypothetical protein
MPNYNVTVGFQYQITANDNAEAADIARGYLAEDIEKVYQYENGAEQLVKHTVTTILPGLDYNEVMEGVWANS